MIDWVKALDLEQRVADIICQQEINGVEFDITKAYQYVDDLTERKLELYQKIRPELDFEISVPYKVEIKKPFIASGGYSANVTKWCKDEKELQSISGPFTRVEFVEPDIGSRQKLIKQLLRFGWKPTIFTDTGQPKLTVKGEPVDTLTQIEGDIGKYIAEWYTLGHRCSQIQGWIKNIRSDGRLTAGADSCGTNTYRFRHKNVVNVPKADPKVIFGYEMRNLFIAKQGYWLVGHDASGLEARVMAHYTTPYDNGEFAHEILHGDIHSKNARIFYPEETQGLEKGNPLFDSYRSKSKNGFYGLIYGAQPTKLASTLDVPLNVGRYLFEAFWKENYALGQLRDKIIRMSERNGWIPGIDGRKVFTRSSHSALNALFQSAGAIIMKNSIVILDHWVKREGLDVHKVLDMHDEAQAEQNESEVVYIEVDSEVEALSYHKEGQIWMPPTLLHNSTRFKTGYTRYGELAVKSIARAGTYLNIRCPLDAEYKIGRSWASTH